MHLRPCFSEIRSKYDGKPSTWSSSSPVKSALVSDITRGDQGKVRKRKAALQAAGKELSKHKQYTSRLYFVSKC